MTTQTYIKTAGLLWVLLSFVILSYSNYTLKELGFNFNSKIFDKKLLWLIPLLIVEILPLLLGGLIEKFSYDSFKLLMYFTIALSINEEIFYRVFILRFLNLKSLSFGILVSSLIFGITYISGAIANGGGDFIFVALHFIFGFLLGFIFALIVTLKNSIVIPIIWHTLSELILLFVSTKVSNESIKITVSLQILILLIFTIHLLKQVKQSGINLNEYKIQRTDFLN